MREQAGLPKEGDIVAGKYRIEKVAGEGGMGVVYAAHHLVLDRRVALKVLMVDRARGDEVIERFVREAQAAARLQSEHVVRVMNTDPSRMTSPSLSWSTSKGATSPTCSAGRGPSASRTLRTTRSRSSLRWRKRMPPGSSIAT